MFTLERAVRKAFHCILVYLSAPRTDTAVLILLFFIENNDCIEIHDYLGSKPMGVQNTAKQRLDFAQNGLIYASFKVLRPNHTS